MIEIKNTSNALLPEKLIVGRSGKMAWINFYEATGKIKNEKSITGWSSGKPKEFKNEVLDRCLQIKDTDYHGNRFSDNILFVNIEDTQHDWIFQLPIDTVINLIHHYTIFNGRILGEFYYYFPDFTNTNCKVSLIDVNDIKNIKKIKEFTKNYYETPVTNDTLVPGNIYKLADKHTFTYKDNKNPEVMYLGRFHRRYVTYTDQYYEDFKKDGYWTTSKQDFHGAYYLPKSWMNDLGDKQFDYFYNIKFKLTHVFARTNNGKTQLMFLDKVGKQFVCSRKGDDKQLQKYIDEYNNSRFSKSVNVVDKTMDLKLNMKWKNDGKYEKPLHLTPDDFECGIFEVHAFNKTFNEQTYTDGAVLTFSNGDKVHIGRWYYSYEDDYSCKKLNGGKYRDPNWKTAFVEKNKHYLTASNKFYDSVIYPYI